MNKIVVDYSSKNILEDESMDEVVWMFCEKNYKNNECGSPDEMMSDIIAIEYFPSATFKDLLTKYYEEQGMDIAEKVRNYTEYKKGFLMEHGCGYAWENDDLYNRDKKKFLEWLDAKGFQLVDE